MFYDVPTVDVEIRFLGSQNDNPPNWIWGFMCENVLLSPIVFTTASATQRPGFGGFCSFIVPPN